MARADPFPTSPTRSCRSGSRPSRWRTSASSAASWLRRSQSSVRAGAATPHPNVVLLPCDESPPTLPRRADPDERERRGARPGQGALHGRGQRGHGRKPQAGRLGELGERVLGGPGPRAAAPHPEPGYGDRGPLGHNLGRVLHPRGASNSFSQEKTPSMQLNTAKGQGTSTSRHGTILRR